MGTFRQVCRKNHICRGPDETHTVDTVEYMYKHSAKFERSVLKTVGELAIAAQTMYRNGVCHDFSVLKKKTNIKVHSATSYLIFQQEI
jgi:hypothetical protein